MLLINMLKVYEQERHTLADLSLVRRYKCCSGVIHVKAMEGGLQSELKAQVAHPFHKTCQTAAYKTVNMVNNKHWSLLPVIFSSMPL